MRVFGILSAVMAAVLLSFSAAAQQMKTVQGLVINIGIVAAIEAEHTDAQHGVHKGGHGGGMEHIVVALSEEKGGARISDAAVTIEVRDPKGVVQKKPAMAMVTAGFPDYSEVFQFGWSGEYRVTVLVYRKDAAKPVQARFTVKRVL
jgi:hypothetical protein